MEEFLGKKYVLAYEENLDDYLKFTGVPYVNRKIASTVRPVQSLTRNEDGTYTFNVKASLFNTDIVFTPGEEFDEKKADGKIIRTIITFEDNKMIQIQNHGKGIITKHVIEFYPDKNIVTTTAEGLDKIVIRHYKLEG